MKELPLRELPETEIFQRQRLGLNGFLDRFVDVSCVVLRLLCKVESSVRTMIVQIGIYGDW